MAGMAESGSDFREPDLSKDLIGEDKLVRYAQLVARALPKPPDDDYSRNAQAKRANARLAGIYAKDNEVDVGDPALKVLVEFAMLGFRLPSVED